MVRLLNKVCQFLGVETTEDYLNDCASIVFNSPQKSRFNAPWNDKLIECVKTNLSEFDCLKEYSYDD